MTCDSYVELNPVRTRMLKEPKEYRWSSYGANAYGKKDDLVDEPVIYGTLSSDENIRKEYRNFIQEMLQKKEAMPGEMDRRTICGGGEFLKRVQNKFKLDAVIKKRGRPRKELSDKPIEP